MEDDRGPLLLRERKRYGGEREIRVRDTRECTNREGEGERDEEGMKEEGRKTQSGRLVGNSIELSIFILE